MMEANGTPASWDIIDKELDWQGRQERTARKNESRHRLVVEKSSFMRNCLLFIMCLFLLIQTGLLAAWEVRYQVAKQRANELIEQSETYIEELRGNRLSGNRD